MGRQKIFCVDQALARALEVFWRHGFEGTSMAELTSAMGIAKPSLYAAYGNKEQLFRKALDLYDREHMSFMREALEARTSRDVAEAILLGMVDATTSGGEYPPGCMSMNGALACSAAADPVKEEILRRRKIVEGELVRRFRRAHDEGDLPAESDPAALASFVMTVASGIAFQASTGVPAALLRVTAELTLRAWPASGTDPCPIATHKLSA